MILVFEFADDQDGGSFTTAGTNVTSSVLDLEVANRDIGEGSQIFSCPGVGDEAVDSAADGASVQFVLEHSDDDSTYVELMSHGAAIAEATLVAGYQLAKQPLPEKCKRYLRGRFIVTGEDLTAGYFNWNLQTT